LIVPQRWSPAHLLARLPRARVSSSVSSRNRGAAARVLFFPAKTRRRFASWFSRFPPKRGTVRVLAVSGSSPPPLVSPHSLGFRAAVVIFPSARNVSTLPVFDCFLAQRAAVSCLVFGVSGLAKRAPLHRWPFSIFQPALDFPPAGVPSDSLLLSRRATTRPRSSFNHAAPCFSHSYLGFCAALVFSSVEARSAAAALSRSPVCAPPLSSVWFPLLFSFPQARFRCHRWDVFPSVGCSCV
jgi:hypothetical protein